MNVIYLFPYLDLRTAHALNLPVPPLTLFSADRAIG
jgi:hypothetical protein